MADGKRRSFDLKLDPHRRSVEVQMSPSPAELTLPPYAAPESFSGGAAAAGTCERQIGRELTRQP